MPRRGADDPAGQDGGMGQVVATTERVVLPEQYSEYRVDAGGQGAGTRAHWRLQATSKRARVQDVTVTGGPAGELVERDANSAWSTWSVHRTDERWSTVRVRGEWTGTGGIGGFFERTFAPKGLARIHHALLERLGREGAVG